MHRTRSKAQRSISQLLRDLDVTHSRGSLNMPVRGISDHSDSVKPGYLFVAVSGTNQDGHRFVQAAVERGAVGLVVEQMQEDLPEGFTQIQVSDTRKALANLAASFYRHPARELTLVGITGTNGKTTTASLLEGMLKTAGCRVGVLGTIEYRYGDRRLPASTTTPGPVELQRILREMVDSGVTHAVIEVTSHALDQYRVHGCRFQVAVFTNLTRDHLDYHRDMNAYLEAKIRLFEDYLRTEAEDGWAVINSESPASQRIESHCRGRVIRFGYDPSATFRALKWNVNLNGIQLVFRSPDGEMEVFSPLLGQPNLLNVLAACACAWALGVEPNEWREGLRSVSSIPGRFERVRNDRGVSVIVDYAHTPDALEQVLATARNLTRGKLICVFGCGGDRDQGKRPLMAQAAARSSDLVVITSDNPRTEPPGAIIDQVVNGLANMEIKQTALSNGEPMLRLPAYAVIEDRGEAIRKTIRWAKAGDMVIIAGKGHEAVQIVGANRIPFDDCEVARRALEEVVP